MTTPNATKGESLFQICEGMFVITVRLNYLSDQSNHLKVILQAYHSLLPYSLSSCHCQDWRQGAAAANFWLQTRAKASKYTNARCAFRYRCQQHLIWRLHSA